jgi:hypothetical protein
MSLISVIGAGLQLALLLLTNWFKYSDKKAEERKELKDEGIKAIRAGDASRITAVFARLR